MPAATERSLSLAGGGAAIACRARVLEAWHVECSETLAQPARPSQPTGLTPSKSGAAHSQRIEKVIIRR
jgi:hypothetical protein